jgi:hypothetical protein
MNVIEQAIVDMCENATVTSTELITLITGQSLEQKPMMNRQTAENTILLIDHAIAKFSDGFLYDDNDTEEENYDRANNIIMVLEDTREYFECVLEYIECQN